MTDFAVAFVAGFFGLIPLIWQISTTRAQRQDRMTRLTHLRAELELLERLSTLQGEVSAGDEAAKRELDLTIKNTLNKLLVQYNTLSEIAPSKMAPSTVGGDEQPAPRQLSFLRRALLLYDPNTALGWILHTVFYVVSIIFAVLSFFYFVGSIVEEGNVARDFATWAFFATLFVTVLLVVRHFGRRHAAPQKEADLSQVRS